MTAHEEAPLAPELSERDAQIGVPGGRGGWRAALALAAVAAAVLAASAVAFLVVPVHAKASPQSGAFLDGAPGHVSLGEGQIAAALDNASGPEPVPAAGSYQPGQASGPSATCPPGCGGNSICCGSSCCAAGGICCNNRAGLCCSKGSVCCGLQKCCASTLMCYQANVVDPTHHQPQCGSGQQF